MIYLVLFLGLILRLISINQSLWLDEATSALVAKMPINDIFTKFLPGDFHPPLYYIVLKFWVGVFGSSEITLRVPSVLFGLGTIFVLYLIGKELFDKKTAIIASLFLATSGLHIYYSQEARMYSLAALLVSLSVYLFIKEKWFLLSIALLLMGLNDYVSLFILPAFLIAGYKEWRKIILASVPLVIGFLVWLPVFIKQISAGISIQGTAWWNILGTATLKNIALIPVKFFIGRVSFDNKWLYLLVVTAISALFCYLLFKARKSNAILWSWLVIPVIIGIVISLKVPTLTYFRSLFSLPALYILASAGLQKTGKYKNFIMCAVIFFNITTSGYYLLNPVLHREDWRGAAMAIGQKKIIFPANSQKEALTYYGKSGQIVSVSDLGEKDTVVWLSRYVYEIFDPKDIARRSVESLGYNKVSESSFNGVVLWKYSK